MSRVNECDVCGETYELGGIGRNHGKVSVPFTYRVWSILPNQRDRVGWVKQDLCEECNNNLQDALRLLKGGE